MKQLPQGVYCVSEAFAQQEGAVSFSFQGCDYEAQIGKNAFHSMEQLITQPLTPPAEAFCGYRDTPVILLPAGVFRAFAHAKTKEEGLRTYFPCAVTILGELLFRLLCHQRRAPRHYDGGRHRSAGKDLR